MKRLERLEPTTVPSTALNFMQMRAACMISMACIAWIQPGFAVSASEPIAPEHASCIVPAKPGGGFDLSCQLVREGLQGNGSLSTPLEILYRPGGIGAVAYNTAITQPAAQGDAITAFSSGSLLNLAQRKFGRYDETAVRWLAGIGIDYGMLAVRSDSPYTTLAEFVRGLQQHPESMIFGSGGAVGSQDWLKTALLARQAKLKPSRLRYVAFEGGGEALTALLSGHIQAICGDIGEAATEIESGRIRILAVFSEQRLPGKLGTLPTAREQGYELTWPVIRGFYVGRGISDARYAWWRSNFEKMLQTPAFDQLRSEHRLFPLALTGEALDEFIHQQMAQYRELSRSEGLVE